ncbi:MAG: hypothetical protein EXQ81_06000 [Thermoleophilia bacterium]|nr:hypothetical protein [Thermoleophilia bacterium]
MTTLLTGSIAIVLVAMLAGVGLAAGGKKAAAGDTCLVTDVSGLNDKSFNALANKGRLDGERVLGVKTSVLQSSKESDYIPNLLACVQRGADQHRRREVPEQQVCDHRLTAWCAGVQAGEHARHPLP